MTTIDPPAARGVCVCLYVCVCCDGEKWVGGGGVKQYNTFRNRRLRCFVVMYSFACKGFTLIAFLSCSVHFGLKLSSEKCSGGLVSKRCRKHVENFSWHEIAEHNYSRYFPEQVDLLKHQVEACVSDNIRGFSPCVTFSVTNHRYIQICYACGLFLITFLIEIKHIQTI